MSKMIDKIDIKTELMELAVSAYFEYFKIDIYLSFMDKWNLKSLLIIMNVVVGILWKFKDEKNSNKILDKLTRQTKQMSENDMKEIELKSVIKLNAIYGYLLATTNRKDSQTKYIIEFALQMFRSQLFNKKLLSLNIIERTFEFNRNGEKLKGSDDGEILELLKNANFVRLLLEKNANSELIKKAKVILSFLFHYDAIESEDMKLICNFCIRRNDDVVKSIRTVVTEIIKRISIKHLKEMIRTFKSNTQIDEDFIYFVKRFTEEILLKVQVHDQNKQHKFHESLCDLDIFWDIIIGEHKSAIKEAALTSLAQILRNHQQLALDYANRALDQIKDNQNEMWNIKLLKEMNFADPNIQKGLKFKPKDIISMVVKDCCKFHKNTTKELEKNPKCLNKV